MKCDNLRAYLDNELGRLGRVSMRLHLKRCGRCRENLAAWTVIDRCLHEMSEEQESTALAEKVTADAVSAARARTNSPANQWSRILGVFSMKRRLFAVGLVAVLVAVGIGMLPGLRNSRALAGVAYAISNVKSIHLVIRKASPKTGEPSTEELWIKLPSQYRLKGECGDVADDGEKSVTISKSNGLTTVTISPSKGLNGLDPSGSYLALFNFRDLVERFADKVVSRTGTTLPDGRKATVFDLGNCRFVVDDTTNLPVRIEDHWPDGTLKKVIEHIEYDVKIPDSLFTLSVPKDAVVIDAMKSSPFSAEIEHQRLEIASELQSAGAWKLAWRVGVVISSVYGQNSGSVGSPAHPAMRFQPLDYGKAWLFYIPKRNSYFVLGKWLVTDEKTSGYNLVVQDREFPAPRRADVVPLDPPRVIVQSAKPGEYEQFTRLQNVGSKPLTITEKHSWNGGLLYEIQGKAKRIPDGKVYQDETATFEEVVNRPIDSPYPDQLYWGNLSPEEISNLKVYIDLHNRIAAILGNKNADGYPVYDGSEIQCMGWLDDNAPLCEGKLQLTRIHRTALGKGDISQYLGYALRVPDKRIFLCIGHVRVRYPGKPERICVNGVVSFDGEILSSEE